MNGMDPPLDPLPERGGRSRKGRGISYKKVFGGGGDRADWRGSLAIGEREFVVGDINVDLAALREFAEENLVGEYARDLILNETVERTRAEARVVTVLGEPFFRHRGNFQLDLVGLEPVRQFAKELVDDAFDDNGAQRREFDYRGEAGSGLRRAQAVGDPARRGRLYVTAPTQRPTGALPCTRARGPHAKYPSGI